MKNLFLLLTITLGLSASAQNDTTQQRMNDAGKALQAAALCKNMSMVVTAATSLGVLELSRNDPSAVASVATIGYAVALVLQVRGNTMVARAGRILRGYHLNPALADDAGSASWEEDDDWEVNI